MTDLSIIDPAAPGWNRLGFEVELLAPVGKSRHTLAKTLADNCGGSIRTIFHHDTEPSLVKGRPVFHHLTTGFEVLDPSGSLRCRLVDDVTIQTDLDSAAVPSPGWFRILSDEPRLLRLAEQLTDPESDPTEWLKPLADVFGVTVEPLEGLKFRVDDESGATVAIAAPQGGQRERVTEVITPPLSTDHANQLASLLRPAAQLGFTVPAEAAVHVHLDAEPFRSSAALARMVMAFSADRDELWSTLGTNPACRRLGPLPQALIDGVQAPGFADQPWGQTEAWLKTLPLSKYSDCNLLSLQRRPSLVDTVELRTLPGSLDPASILEGVAELRRRFIGSE